MSTVQYKLDRFEGPLDLLLSLVEKDKVASCIHAGNCAANGLSEHKEMYSGRQIRKKLGYEYVFSFLQGKGHEREHKRNKTDKLSPKS